MLKQLNLLTLPAAISIAAFDATFFIAADLFELTPHETLLGVVAGAIGGTCVLAAVLWQSSRSDATQVASSS